MAKKKNNKGAAVLFLSLLVILFTINAVIAIPLDHTRDLAAGGPPEPGTHGWYALSADDYKIAGYLSSETIRASQRLFPSKHYDYYEITVNPGTQSEYALVVRAAGAKRNKLGRMEKPDF